MIRNVVMGRLRTAADEQQARSDQEQLAAGLAGILAIRLPGLLGMSAGTDERLREGGWDFAIVNDWEDEEAYRQYDLDEEHNRIRREHFGPICSDVARVQFALGTDEVSSS